MLRLRLLAFTAYLVALTGCRSDKGCLDRVCKNTLSILVRHPSEVIPEGDFEAVIEEEGRRTVCRNVVPDDLEEAVPCVTTTIGDAASTQPASDGGAADAGTEPSPYTIYLGLDFYCSGGQTGSGAVSSCSPTGTSYQEVLLVVDRETDPPESVRISVRAGDGTSSEGVVEPRFLPLAINGAGCPGACTQGTATFRMQ